MFELQEWCDWEYPSHWSYVESFISLDEAISELERFRSTAKDPDNFRLVEVIQ